MRLHICHLSDIHFTNEKNSIEDKKDGLCNAILEYALKNEDILFLITGDIAQSGTVEQYKIAGAFFIYIKETLRQRKNINSYFIFAPGNHDAILDPNDIDEVNRREKVLAQKDALDTNELLYYLEKMCKKHDNYYEFVKNFQEYYKISRVKTEKSLLEQYEVNISGNDIFVNVINTAWISKKHEKPGEIFVPKKYYDKKIVKKNGLNITMYHHPSNWMHPNDKIYFDSEIRNQSDIIFVGHEHEGREEYIQTRQAEFEVEYGEVLQDLDNENNSAFKIHQIIDKNICTRIYRWNWNGKYYDETELPAKEIGKDSNKTVCFLPEYREKLNSFDMQITHPKRKKIKLNDLFIFPNIEAYNVKRDFEESTKEKVTISGDNLIQYILEKRYIEFSGGQKIGKSALAKMLALSLEIMDIHATIIDCKKIANKSLNNIEEIRKQSIYKAYGKDKYNIYNQLFPDRKILILDNIDAVKNERFKRDIIEYYSNYYNYIISFTSMSYELAMLEETIQPNDGIVIKHCTIKELGHKQRNRLYKKWYMLNEGDDIILEEEIEKKIKEATSTINILKGNGYMPCIAPNIIIILQQLEFQPERKQDRSNYGHMYEFLIDKSMLDMKNNCPLISVDIASTILIWVAQYMLEKNCRIIEKKIFTQIVEEYNSHFLTEASKDIYLKEYINVDLVEVENDEIKFKYPYIYYYFTAKYLSDNISKKDVKDIIDYMAKNLQNAECGDIMIFLCHLSKQPYIFNSVLKNSKNLLAEIKKFDFAEYKDIKMNFEEHLNTNFFPETGKEERKEKILEQKDRYEEEYENEIKKQNQEREEDDYDDTELQEKMEIIDGVYKSIEVMGQILKNYPGTIDKNVKIDLLSEAHALGMRSLTYSYDMIKSEMRKILLKLCKKIQKELNKQDVAIDEGILVKYVEEQSYELKYLTDNIFGLTCYTLIRRLANSVGNEDLKPLINFVVKDDIISYQLMSKSIYLNEFGIIQGDTLISLYEDLLRTRNNFAAKILKLLVYDHYYVFGSNDIRMRQKIWSKMSFNKQQEDMVLLTQAEISN